MDEARETVPGAVTPEEAERLRLAAMAAALPPAETEPPKDAVPEKQIPEKVFLGGGNYALLRLPSELRAKHTKAALRGAAVNGIQGFSEGLLPYIVKEWTLRDEDDKLLPVPTGDNPDPLDEITTLQYLELLSVSAMYMAILVPDTAFKEFNRSFESPTSASGD